MKRGVRLAKKHKRNTLPEKYGFAVKGTNPPLLELRMADNGIGVDTSSLQVFSGINTLAFSCDFTNLEHTLCNLNEFLPEGPVEWQATVNDYANNGSDTTVVHFTVDTIDPQISISNPVNNSATHIPNQILQGTVSESATVEINGSAVTVQADNSFSQTLTLSEGSNGFTIIATDPAGNSGTYELNVVLDTVAPVIPVASLISLLGPVNGNVTVSGAAGSVEPNATITVKNTATGLTAYVTSDVSGAFSVVIAASGGDILELTVVDAAGNQSPALSLSTGGSSLPPDPASIATPIEPGVVTAILDSVRFLYTAPTPIQTGVDESRIEARRAAVLRGRVFDRSSAPLSAVLVSVKDHPEFGSTLSREDGTYDMVVNGGGQLVLNYKKTAFLPSQKKVEVPWRNYVRVTDTILVTLDSQVTNVTSGASTPAQVARGSAVTDSDGTRQATVLFPSGTQAHMILPDGSSQALADMHVRATEYTAGPNGPAAMPGALPANSGYTYAVELSVDEAIDAGAVKVQFDRPLAFYVENFLNFPAGSTIPVGFYDSVKSCWTPSANGRVIKILGVSQGLAEMDIAGAGIPASPAELLNLGVSDEERAQLASIYTPGTRLWRAPVSHFTAWDHNWPFGPPAEAKPPQLPDPVDNTSEDDCDDDCNSFIEVQNQVFGESVPIAGTDYILSYRSDRVAGRTAMYTVQAPISGPVLPAGLKGIEFEVTVAGQYYRQSFAAAPNQTAAFIWDGKDLYGRVLKGKQIASIRVGYVYDAVYQEAFDYFASSFAQYSGVSLSGNRTRQEVTLWQERALALGNPFPAPLGIEGWSLNVHHSFDPASQTLYMGDGTRRGSGHFPRSETVETIAGTGSAGFTGDGGLAKVAKITYPKGIATAPDGAVYFIDSNNIRIRKIAADGIISTVAGTGVRGFAGDGGPATAAQLAQPELLAIASDGSLYVADNANYRVRKITKDGVITTVAGTGVEGFSGDGGPATQADIGWIGGMAVSDGCDLYITEVYNYRLRKISCDGVIETIAGTGVDGTSGDGGPALNAQLSAPGDMVIGADGSLYFIDYIVVRQITPDGIIRRYAGGGAPPDETGDLGPATEANIEGALSLAFTPSGDLLISEGFPPRLRRVTPDGIISTLAGTGSFGFNGDGLPAAVTQFFWGESIDVGPDGTVYVADIFNSRVRKISYPQFAAAHVIVLSSDGAESYEFDAKGRHLRTANALTNATVLTFQYDTNGLLASIVDNDGNTTTLTRNGNNLQMTGPFGATVNLAVDNNGDLRSIANLDASSYAMTYLNGHLLTTFTDPKQNQSLITYHGDGRLNRDTNAAGGFIELTRQELSDGYEVSRVTAEGRTFSNRVEKLANGEETRRNVRSDGTVQTQVNGVSGTRTTTDPNGTVVTERYSPDPRFGMQSAYLSRYEIKTPNQASAVMNVTRTVTLANPSDPLSLLSQTERVAMNGRTFTSTFDAATLTVTDTTPQGRQTITVYDVYGKAIQKQVAGVHPINYFYDNRGRVETITWGTRMYTVGYDADGYVGTITMPMNYVFNYHYNAAGRLDIATLPGNRIVGYGYDLNGNITAVTPPGKPAHAFDFDAVDLLATYTPPLLGTQPVLSGYTYNLDKQPDLVNQPGGGQIDFDYTEAGKLSTVTIPRGIIRYDYDPVTGQLHNILTPENVSLVYAYDGFLPKSETVSGPVAGTVSKVYDTSYRLSGVGVNGAVITLGYDNDDLLTRAGDLTLTRRTDNGLIDTTLLNTVGSSYGYNLYGENESQSSIVNGAPLYLESVQRDDLGRITQKTETVSGVTTVTDYSYDPAGRLDTVTVDGVLVSDYHYDANGNRDGGFNRDGAITAIHDDQDRLNRYNGKTFAYTFNGDLQSKTEGGQTTSYAYDEFGNLLAVTLPDNTTVTYVVDGRNRRIGKKVDGTLVKAYLYRNQNKY